MKSAVVAAKKCVVAAAVIAITVGALAPSGAEARRRHRHHHRHLPPVEIGPGTPGAPIAFTPNPVVLGVDGGFAGALTGVGLPPGMPLLIDDSALSVGCSGVPDGGGGGDDRSADPATGAPKPPLEIPPADAAGGFSLAVAKAGPCVPGVYPVVVTEQNSPFQSFVVYVVLQPAV